MDMPNYYSKLISCFAKIAAPLYKLLHKNMKWIGSSNHIEAMHALHKAFFSRLILCLPDFQKAFQFETNASDFEIGDVLLQC